ncbi:hypothetical protein [Paenibacillus aceris]|uniref:Rhamnogalacturonan I lyase beta-sheet domain-containing protein n=1 Tax=Paenibacillus aceris TaxID=869555 RepID=A0ABS4I420_9BACL|nr:hypothetical protein [Paenibacillus aceris]MBP1965558.1 hypothetical protein [Paenibacillus aceris]
MAAKVGMSSIVALSGFSVVGAEQSHAMEAKSVHYRFMDKLNRAPVAVKTSDGVYVGWRLLGTDSPDIGFNLYRDGVKLNTVPIIQSTNYLDSNGAVDSVYEIKPV